MQKRVLSSFLALFSVVLLVTYVFARSQVEGSVSMLPNEAAATDDLVIVSVHNLTVDSASIAGVVASASPLSSTSGLSSTVLLILVFCIVVFILGGNIDSAAVRKNRQMGNYGSRDAHDLIMEDQSLIDVVADDDV